MRHEENLCDRANSVNGNKPPSVEPARQGERDSLAQTDYKR